jgi:hypothetical protein
LKEETDLTLRSDKTFGSFQLVSLFCQDYLGLAVLRQVALPPSAVSASVQAVQQPGSYLAVSPMPSQTHFDTSPYQLFQDGAQHAMPPPQAYEFPNYGDQPADLLLAPADFPLDFNAAGFHDAMPQYATFGGELSSFGQHHSKGSAMLTPLALNHGDLTAKAGDAYGGVTGHAEWPSSLIPVTPLSPTFLIAPSH